MVVLLCFFRQQVKELSGQRDATIYWRQELEEAHVGFILFSRNLSYVNSYFLLKQERIEALSHQNVELKKRVVWNLSQDSSKNDRKPRQDNGNHNEMEQRPHSSSETGNYQATRYQISEITIVNCGSLYF